MRLLLIEDDAKVSQLVRTFLESQAFTVDVAADGSAGLGRARSSAYDCILLDLGLPGTPDGLAVCKTLRQAGEQVPILVLTARRTLAARVEGLDGGADGYPMKPFMVGERAAR